MSSGGQSSEARTLPPSEKKLRDARGRGQIGNSSDVVAAVSIGAITLYLLFAWSSIRDQIGRLFDMSFLVTSRGESDTFQAAMRETTDAISTIIMPLFLIAIFAVFLGTVISNKGVIASFDPVKPDFKRLDPGAGFKRIFSLRNLVELLKASIKCAVLLGALGASAWYGLGAVLRIPYCQSDCAGEALAAVAGPLVALATLMFLLAALIDSRLQRWLFSRDMRMTHSESRREMKESYGDPQLRGARKEEQRAFYAGKGVQQDRPATLVVYAADEVAVALRYFAGETAAPVVVQKGSGARANTVIAEAVDQGVPIRDDPALARDLMRRAKMDSYIPESLFEAVAAAFDHRDYR